ncbi:MAG: enoyl-CoA hydratase [Alphaproteobacteria bacterium]|nr:MAG: enoyl-CoA hydratase [Alphaproteobacteria bacterium]
MTAGTGADGLLSWEMRDGVALIGLNRPAKRNAISDAVIAAIDEAVARAEAEARAGVIFGHGGNFSAGLDLAEQAERSALDDLENSRRWGRAFDRIQRGRLPWFAALQGAVIGGGLELAAAVHVRVADETAYFALPEGQRGIYTGGGASVRVARLMGAHRMADMMLTGRVVTAAEAEAWGVVQYRVPAGEALARAEALARKAASNAPLSNFAIIQALPRIQDMSHEDGLFAERLMAALTMTTPEARANLRAFLEKRAGRLAVPDEADD